MANGYSTRGLITRVVILVILIMVALGGALILFDRLGLIQLGGSSSLFYEAVGLAPKGSSNLMTDPSLVERDRLDKSVETLNDREFELKQREEALDTRESELKEMAERLDEQERLFFEKEGSLSQAINAYDNKNDNLLRQATYLSNMPPAAAIQILLGMNDQDFIDTLRATERYAALNGSVSLVSVWLQLIAMLPDTVVNGQPVKPTNAERVAIIMRKMALKSSSPEE